MEKVLEKLNEFIRAEHGKRVQLDDKLIDSELDSFGTVMVLADMDNEYKKFDRDWLKTVNILELTIQEIVDRVLHEGD